MTGLLLAGLAVVAAVGGYVAFGRKKSTSNPDCTVAEAWDRCMTEDGSRTALEREGCGYLRALDQEAATQLRGRLQPLEEKLSGSHGRRRLREAIMDVTDRYLFAEAVTQRQRAEGEEVDPGLRRLYEHRLAQACVLRCLAGMRYADRAADDWYTHYVKLARLNVKNVATMVDRTTHGDQAELESSLHNSLTRAMTGMRDDLLDHPPRQPVRTHTPIEVEAVKSRGSEALSSTELELLTTLMKGRLTRILMGELYADEDEVLEPARAFALDASLLYALLADRLKQPSHDWQRIVEMTLGEGAVPHDIEQLRDRGVQLHEVWKQHSSEGPLQKALVVGYRQARAGDDSGSVPLGVIEDAGGLLRDVQAILGRS